MVLNLTHDAKSPLIHLLILSYIFFCFVCVEFLSIKSITAVCVYVFWLSCNSHDHIDRPGGCDMWRPDNKIKPVLVNSFFIDYMIKRNILSLDFVYSDEVTIGVLRLL